MTTHSGCCWDYPEDVALAYGKVRGIKLALNSLYDDDDASAAVLDEIGDCAECLRCLVRFLAGLAGSLGVSVAEAHGADESAAIRQFEKMLAEYEREIP
jgi:hypothetical protein